MALIQYTFVSILQSFIDTRVICYDQLALVYMGTNIKGWDLQMMGNLYFELKLMNLDS